MTRTVPPSAYKVLGVSPKDDFAAIKAAWRDLVKANHPDVVGGDPARATARLREINDAYDALRWHIRADALARAEADLTLPAGNWTSVAEGLQGAVAPEGKAVKLPGWGYAVLAKEGE